MVPWNKPEPWESGGNLAGMTDRRHFSDPESRRHHGILRHHHDSVADKEIFRIEIIGFAFRRDDNPVGNASIFVDDGAIDHAIASDANVGQRRVAPGQLEMIRSHDDTISNGGTALDDTANADDTSL